VFHVSRRLRDTTGPSISEFEDELRINNFPGTTHKRPERLFLQLSYTNWKTLQNSRTPSSKESDRSFRLIFKWVLTYILVCMLATHEKKRRTRDPETYTRTFAASGFFGEIHRSGFPERRHRYNSRRHQRHQGSALLPLREQKKP